MRSPRRARALLPLLLSLAVLPSLAGSCKPPQPFGEEMLENGGFESGALTPGWSLAAGACQVEGPGFSRATAPEGDFLLHGGAPGGSADCRVSQEIDLLAARLRPGWIDTGSIGARAVAWLRGFEPTGRFDDQSFLRLHYLDELGEPIGSLRTLISEGPAWTERIASGLLPPGTRFVRAELEARHRTGSLNDGMADDASLRFEDGRGAPQAPLLTKQPFLQNPRGDAMTVMWETDSNPGDHAVEYGTAGSGLTSNESRTETTQVSPDHFVHRVTLEGLQMETDYDYRVRSGATTSATFGFRTAPQPTTPIRIAWFADNQNGPGVLAEHVPRIAARFPDLVIVPGDHVQNGDDLPKWDTEWFDPMQISSLAQTTPVVVARGNHDREHAYSYAYSALPGNGSWTTFVWGNTFFVVLDTEAPTDALPAEHSQLEFLSQALDSPEALAAEFRVVTFHKPPYTNLWDSSNNSNCSGPSPSPYMGQAPVRNDWVPVFEQKNVDLVVSGHTHSYQHGEQASVHYLLVGGGGGALDTVRGCFGSTFWSFIDSEASVFHYAVMDVDGTELQWTAYDLSDQVVHQFQIQH